VRSLLLFWLLLACPFATADEKGDPRRPFHSELGMTFVRIPAGQFLMGSDESASDLRKAGFEPPEDVDFSNESPAHPVVLSRFGMLTTEVTRAQFAAFVKATSYVTDAEKDGRGGHGYNPQTQTAQQDPRFSWRRTGFPQSDNHPVVNVSWNDAEAFCRWLTQQSVDRGETYSYLLPTEAQWEYAARARSRTRFASGDEPLSLHEFGNVQDASFEVEFTKINFEKHPGFGFIDGNVFTAVCGAYRPNAFGLHDMHGNVWEWCRDRYDSQYYARSPRVDPAGPDSGDTRVLRGGSWNDAPHFVRSAFRISRSPDGRCNLAGFRVVLQEGSEADRPGR
jgi:sulfatase modifying factor 1